MCLISPHLRNHGVVGRETDYIFATCPKMQKLEKWKNPPDLPDAPGDRGARCATPRPPARSDGESETRRLPGATPASGDWGVGSPLPSSLPPPCSQSGAHYGGAHYGGARAAPPLKIEDLFWPPISKGPYQNWPIFKKRGPVIFNFQKEGGPVIFNFQKEGGPRIKIDQFSKKGGPVSKLTNFQKRGGPYQNWPIFKKRGGRLPP